MVKLLVRQHGHGETRGAANLYRMGVSRVDAKTLGERGCEHDVRRHRRIAAKNAIDLAALEARIRDRKLGCLAHEVERGKALVLAIGGETDAGDVAHVLAIPSDVVIPGRERSERARNP